jgi:LacI family transcriptional regulator
MRALLAQQPSLTAVMAASDLLAAGALQTLYERDIHVPHAISVVGFDDTFASRLAPPLTTVHQPMFEMGVCAAEMAIQILSGELPLGATEWCSTSLVVRQSTSPPHLEASPTLSTPK